MKSIKFAFIIHLTFSNKLCYNEVMLNKFEVFCDVRVTNWPLMSWFSVNFRPQNVQYENRETQTSLSRWYSMSEFLTIQLDE